MEKVIMREVSTKPYADGDAVKTALSIDLSQLTPEDVIEYAVQTLVIKWQGIVRRKESIPTEAEYVAPRPGTKSTVIDFKAALVRGFGKAKAEALIGKYGTAEDAFKAIEALMA